jgi:hypothetical protein
VEMFTISPLAEVKEQAWRSLQISDNVFPMRVATPSESPPQHRQRAYAMKSRNATTT